jgi:hypothetical protein
VGRKNGKEEEKLHTDHTQRKLNLLVSTIYKFHYNLHRVAKRDVMASDYEKY